MIELYGVLRCFMSLLNDLLNSDETIQMHYKNEVIKNQQCIKNTRSSIKQQLQKNFLKIGLKLKTTFRIALDKNIQTRKLKKIIAWKNT